MPIVKRKSKIYRTEEEEEEEEVEEERKKEREREELCRTSARKAVRFLRRSVGVAVARTCELRDAKIR